MASALEIAAAIDLLAVGLVPAVDAAIEVTLDELQVRCEQVNPVRTRRMQEGYSVEMRVGGGDLWNAMDYTLFVFRGTRYMSANEALNNVLDGADDLLAANAAAGITTLVDFTIGRL